VILEDIAPPREHLGPLRSPCHWVPTRSSPSAVWAVHTGIWLETLVLGRTCRGWVRDVGANRTRWRSAQNIGVGSYRIHILAILPGVFRVRGGCQRWDSPVVLVLCFPCFDILCTPTSLDKMRGGARFEVGWAAHIRRGCPGRCFGRFGVRGGFRGFRRPFAFMFVSVGHRRIGGGYSQCWAVCPGRFHGVHGPGRHSLTWVTW